MIRLLGRVTLDLGHARVAAGPAKQSAVLAVLALNANHAVPLDSIVDRIWDEGPPPAVRSAVYAYIARLRKLLERLPDVRLSRDGIGYVLGIEPDRVDVLAMRRAAAVAARAVTAGETSHAAGLWRSALELWHGDEALTGVPGYWAARQREALESERLEILAGLYTAELRLDRHRAVVGELAQAVADRPLAEGLVARLMLALYRCGRQAEALEAYERCQRRLRDELGCGPGPEMSAAHHTVLTAEATGAVWSEVPVTPAPVRTEVSGSGSGSMRAPVSDAPSAAAPTAATSIRGASSLSRVVPRQLPTGPRWFVGRENQLAELTKAMDRLGEPCGAAVITSIGGSGGIGKTSLALHWAHQNAARFPDGQLYVDLQGFDPSEEPVAPDVAVRGFLDALGVGASSAPLAPQALTGLYRSLVADRRMLIVLDNAADSEQVATLLPGCATCAVLVTSRRRLTGLATTRGAQILTLDMLTDTEARELLSHHLGEEQLRAEPGAVAAVVGHCAGLPLALGVVAAHAAAQPHFPLAALAEELREESARLDALDGGDLTANVRVAFSVSYRALTPGAAELFRLLGLAPGTETSEAAVSSLLGAPMAATRRILRELEVVHLVRRSAPGRYRLHDLLHLYAAERAVADQPEPSQDQALRRQMDFYLHTARAGAAILSPLSHHSLEMDAPLAGVTLEHLPDQAAVMEWFRAEHSCLIAAQRLAAERGWDVLVWHLARVVDGFLWRQGHLHDHAALWRTGLAAAERLGEAGAQAWALRRLAHACARAGNHKAAVAHAGQALAAASEAGDTAEQARIHDVMAWAWARQGDDRQALTHVHHTLRLQRLLNDPLAVANALNAVGWYEARLGDYRTALTHCEEGLAIHRREGFRDGQACTLDSLGYIALSANRHADALDYYRQALALFHDLGNIYEEANTLANIGDVHLAHGRLPDARENWQQAITLYQSQHRKEDAERLQAKLDSMRPPS
ncbi:BTAD domain-containing putative transcriptional regulator [Streptomyces sp. NPDC094034]|uniref:AfsR/SARP family transcriptional regulator n=1 Tax=Streptomyces sp. NPDC094034 TaxID=3155309 RepID=UPI00331BDBE2